MNNLDPRILILGKDKPYQGFEDDLQIAVVNMLWLRYKKYIWYHVPNGGKRNAREAAKFKRMGVMAGVSDIIFDEPRGGYHGLRIELKVKRGKTTDSQDTFLNKATEKGYLCAVSWNFDATKQLIEDYLNGIHTKTEKEVIPA